MCSSISGGSYLSILMTLYMLCIDEFFVYKHKGICKEYSRTQNAIVINAGEML